MKFLKYIVGIIVLCTILCVMVLIYNDKIAKNSPLYYHQGIEFYNNGDYQNAYYNFGKIKWISPLYPMAVYRQAKSAQKIGDYNTAIIKYEDFLAKSSDSVFAKNAKSNLAKSYYYAKRYDEAKIHFENASFMPERDYFLALIEKKNDKQKAANYFLAYLKNSLIDEIAPKDYVLGAAIELSELSLSYSYNDFKLIAMGYYVGQKYSKSLEYFSKLPISDCWDYLVLANHYAGNKLIAKKLIESGMSSYAKSANVDRLHNIYDIYVSYMTSSRLTNWQKMNNLVLQNSLPAHDYVMYKLAGILSGTRAVAVYSSLYQKYPDSNYAPESLWNVFWDNYTKKDYKQAQALALKHIQLFENVKSTPKIIFWLAKIQEKMGKPTDAHSNYTKLVNKYPDNYYGLRAESILNKKNDFFKTDKLNKVPIDLSNIEFPMSVSDIDIKDLKLINTLFQMGDYEIWADADFKNPIVDSWLEYKKEKKAKSIVIARDFIDSLDLKPSILSESYKLAYPIYFGEEINIAGKKLGIDPFLISSLIREESYFNENAKSPTNATGLMQIMPSTANYMISKLNVDIENNFILTDVKLNLYLGCNYLKYLKNRFNNDLYVVAAYNGGEGSVSKWIKSFNTSDYDEFVERIPYEETQNYIKKVFRTYHMYKKIYN